MIALGFRAHTGWAAAVALEGPVSEPELIDRRRVELGAGASSRFVFHQAAELAPAAAARHVERARKAVAASARAAVEDLVGALGARVAAVIVGNRPLPDELDAILRSHALLHAAEGELYRTALAAAAEALGLRLVTVPAKGLRELAVATLGDDVDADLAALGRRAGRPWSIDQREASLVAWIALASRGP